MNRCSSHSKIPAAIEGAATMKMIGGIVRFVSVCDPGPSGTCIDTSNRVATPQTMTASMTPITVATTTPPGMFRSESNAASLLQAGILPHGWDADDNREMNSCDHSLSQSPLCVTAMAVTRLPAPRERPRGSSNVFEELFDLVDELRDPLWVHVVDCRLGGELFDVVGQIG